MALEMPAQFMGAARLRWSGRTLSSFKSDNAATAIPLERAAASAAPQIN